MHTLHLTGWDQSVPGHKIIVIKGLRAVADLSLKEAKAIADGVQHGGQPVLVLSKDNLEDVTEAASVLQDHEATVSVDLSAPAGVELEKRVEPSYASCKIAIVLLCHTQGNAEAAYSAAKNTAQAINERPEAEIHREAAAVLWDCFGSGQEVA